MGDDVQIFAAGLGVEQKKVTLKRDNDYGAWCSENSWSWKHCQRINSILKLSGKYQ